MILWLMRRFCFLNAGGLGGGGRTWRQIEVTAEQWSCHGFFPFFHSLFPSVSAHMKKAFQIMMWIDVRQLSPLLGPVRHPTGQRWQHYDGLGIVIPDACHLFTSQPSLISHHRPYNLARTPPTPHLLLPGTLYKTTPYITTAFSPPSPPPNLSLSLTLPLASLGWTQSTHLMH